MNGWIIATLVLSLLSPVFYTKSMLAGISKPHRVTRLVVWMAAVTGVVGVLGSPNLAGIIFAGIFFARATYLLIMSGFYGVGGASRLDIACLVVALAALIVYWVTGSGLLAIGFGILADLIAYIPTFVKTWNKPESEDPTFFGIEAVASLFAVFAIWQLRVDILFPLYFVICSLAVLVLIFRKRIASWFLTAGARETDTHK